MKLIEVATIIMGQSPPSSTYNDIGNGLPFFQGKTDFGFIFPSIRKYCSEPRKIAEVNDILISVRAPVGPVNICNQTSCIGRGIAAIRSKNFHQWFLYFYLIYNEKHIASLGTGSTFHAINKNQLQNLEVLNPPLPEQRKIAYVLSTIQKAIEKQQHIIETTTELKKALMQKLFTEGLHGEKQKQTEIGLVPESWEVLKFSYTIIKDSISKKNQIKSSEIENEGKYPVIDQGKNYIAGFSNNSEKLFYPKQPIIIFGDHTRCFKYIDFPFIIGADGTKALQPNLILFRPKYYYYFLSNLDIKNRGYNRHYRLLKEKFILKPQLKEQEEIANILMKLDKKINLTERKKTKLEELFKSILHQLMTGQTRVNEIEFDCMETSECSAC